MLYQTFECEKCWKISINVYGCPVRGGMEGRISRFKEGRSEDTESNAMSSVICTGGPSTEKTRKESRECGSHWTVLNAYRWPGSTSYRGECSCGVVDGRERGSLRKGGSRNTWRSAGGQTRGRCLDDAVWRVSQAHGLGRRASWASGDSEVLG